MAEAAGFEWESKRDHAVLLVRGEIDIATAPAFRDALDRLIREANSPAFADLSGVTFMDSSGIDALATARRQAEAGGVDLILVAPSPPVRTVLELTGLWEHFEVRPEAP
jgi:anti-sigma B factor antagonist